MKQIRYVGPLGSGVDVYLPDGRIASVPHGEVLKTSDEHAASLLEQAGCWELVEAKPAEKAAKAAGKE